jgi:hypothetical protein
MLRLFEWLRRADARLLSLLAAMEPPTKTETSPWSPHVAALGGVLVLLSGLLLQAHTHVQLALVATGMLLTAPFMQDTIDKARAWAEES